MPISLTKWPMQITFTIYWSYNQPIGTKFTGYDAHMKVYKNSILESKGAWSWSRDLLF